MSLPTIAAYFPFRRIKIVNQAVTPEATEAHIQVQPLSAHLPWMRQAGLRCSQLEPAQSSGSAPCLCSAVAHLSISQGVLCSLSRHPYRGFRAV